MFNAVEYIETLHGQLNATKDAYTFARCSGVQGLEEILESSQKKKKFIAVADSEDGQTFMGAGAGHFERRAFTVFILTRAKYGDMAARETIMAESRSIFRSMVSRIIKDRYTIPVFDPQRIQFYEVPPAFADGTCGIYFIFTVEEPVDLSYNATDWSS